MAVVQRKLPLQMARLRRAHVPNAYFKLGESGLLAGAFAIVCILSLLFLAQTGRVATEGYRLQELKRAQLEAQHEAEQYEFQIAQASRLDVIAQRAQALGMRPATNEQTRYATVEMLQIPVVASNK